MSTQQEILRRTEDAETKLELQRIKGYITELALSAARNEFLPSPWSMELIDPVTETVYSWRGADVLITDNLDHGYKGGSTLIVTPYTKELAGLFILVRDTCVEVTDHMSKYVLYERLAKTVICVHQEEPNLFLRELTLEVLAEWYDIIEDWSRQYET